MHDPKKDAQRTTASESAYVFAAPDASIGGIDRLGFKDANLTGAQMRDASFIRTDPSGTNFAEVKAFRAKFVSTVLAGAKLEGADLTGANLTGATWTNGNQVCREGSIGWGRQPP